MITWERRKMNKRDKKKIAIRNPYATALQKRHGGGVKVHRDKARYTRKVKHKARYEH